MSCVPANQCPPGRDALPVKSCQGGHHTADLDEHRVGEPRMRLPALVNELPDHRRVLGR